MRSLIGLKVSVVLLLLVVTARLNDRPGKSLGFKTPNEVSYKSLTKKDSLVALVS